MTTITKHLIDSIPNELKELNHWVCWKISKRNNGDGGLTKPPCDPLTGFPTDPLLKLYSFNEVCQYRETHSTNFDGIGFYFTGNGISGIDIDNCINEDGEISIEARKVINKVNSYTEISPSGRGIHIILKGTLNGKKGSRCGSYEVYSNKRYFTVTGDIINGKTTVEDRQEQLDWFYENYTKSPVNTEEEEVVKLIESCRNADKFNSLMRGDISDYDNDDSRADAALMSILAFYCKKDSKLMEDVFNTSKLAQREKWKNRDDYRERTIKYAIDQTTTVYEALPTDSQQQRNAKSLLGSFENPCGQFDTSLLPELLKRYVDQICETTDAAPITVTTSVIGMISGFLKKSVVIPESYQSSEGYFERLHPNVYFLNVLESGLFKTTALNKGFRIGYQNEDRIHDTIDNLIDSGEERFPQTIFLPQKTTVEALLDDVDELGGGVILLSEFGAWLQDMQKTYNLGLKSMFTSLYDVPKIFTTSTKRDGRHSIEL